MFFLKSFPCCSENRLKTGNKGYCDYFEAKNQLILYTWPVIIVD